eukprot:gene7329-biopygen7540
MPPRGGGGDGTSTYTTPGALGSCLFVAQQVGPVRKSTPLAREIVAPQKAGALANRRGSMCAAPRAEEPFGASVGRPRAGGWRGGDLFSPKIVRPTLEPKMKVVRPTLEVSAVGVHSGCANDTASGWQKRGFTWPNE